MLQSPVVCNLSGRYQQNENVKALRAIVNAFVVSNLTFGGVGLGSFLFIFYLLSINNPLDYKMLIASKVICLTR